MGRGTDQFRRILNNSSSLGYALWLVPSPDERTTLETFMEFRPLNSKVKEKSRSYPHITPHITLATFDDLPSSLTIDNFPIFGRNFEPPVLKCVSWKQNDTYLGALGIWLSQPSELTRLHTTVTKYLGALGILWESPNFPHISLFYVDEPEERIELVESLKHHLKLTGTSNDNGIPFTQFRGTEIWLVDCTQSVREWRVMGKRNLSFSL